MNTSPKPEAGSIAWTDLTISNAEEVRDFYGAVAGWKTEPVDMGGYSDFIMIAPTSGKNVAGSCHARGVNEGLPPQWLIYITVEDIDNSAKQVSVLGGKVLVQPKDMGSYGRYCVIQDPAGAVAALVEPPK